MLALYVAAPFVLLGFTLAAGAVVAGVRGWRLQASREQMKRGYRASEPAHGRGR
jgi:hypothetical protein